MSAPSSSNSDSGRSMPSLPAYATRWISAFVDPEIACSARIAFSNALAGENVGRADAAPDQLDDLPARRLRDVRAAGVDGGDRRGPWQRQPERLGHARHRRGSPHRLAMAVRAGHPVLDLGELLLGDPSGSELLVVVPAVGARAELLASPAAVEHRATGDDDRRDVRRARAHDRAGFVLSQPVSSTTPSSG